MVSILVHQGVDILSTAPGGGTAVLSGRKKHPHAHVDTCMDIHVLVLDITSMCVNWEMIQSESARQGDSKARHDRNNM